MIPEHPEALQEDPRCSQDRKALVFGACASACLVIAAVAGCIAMFT